MGQLGSTARRHKSVDYPFEPKPCTRAGSDLREQAIDRTKNEIRSPHKVWGVSEQMPGVNALGGREAGLTEPVLAVQAARRLSLLRAINFS